MCRAFRSTTLTFAVVFLAAAAFAENGRRTYDVEIIRDNWGVPHIYGRTDADCAYGLGYAICEDDFQTVQEVAISTRARLGEVQGPDAAAIDFIVHLLGAWNTVNEKYDTDLSPETRAICDAYAAGVNAYVEQHPDEVLLDDIFPMTGKDIVAGFVFRGPFFYGLDRTVRELFGEERQREVSTKELEAADAGEPDYLAEALMTARNFLTAHAGEIGSNTFAVAPDRTADGSTFININSHQPWTGPVAWYEAHVVSEDGWEATGGTFPGAPLILHGHNRDLGWAHTVNSPDLADVYVLEMNPDNENRYRFDGEWRDLEREEVSLSVRLKPDSPMKMKVRREVLRSVHGPVVRQPHGVYAIRYAGMGDVRQVEQWYRMNRAENKDQWIDAMKMRAIPSLNCGYADKDGNIGYLYNALIPVREPGYDWGQYLPGDTSDTLWSEVIAFEELPQVWNPDSGFIQNCNSTPFQTTAGDDNPDPDNYAEWMGIETHMTNRALRAMELLGADEAITWDEFIAYKYDMKYSKDAHIAELIAQMSNAPAPKDELTRGALAILANWDRSTDPENTGAALGVMMALPNHNYNGDVPDADKLFQSLKTAAETVMKTHGRLDVPWKEVNRLQRGDVDLGIGGGPDILHAVYGAPSEDGGRFIGRTGDSLILLVRWDTDGKVHSESIHQFGSASTRPDSPHYADQAELFVKRELKPVLFEREAVEKHAARTYHPADNEAS